jgi:ankyrin repeat protein
MLSYRFQWVFCQLDVLRRCFPVDVRRILEELPESLDETYEHILKRIPTANRQHAYRLLQCLTVAFRPLRVEELAEVLALDFSMGVIPKLNTDWRWEDQEEAVLSACSSLVSVVNDNGCRVVQFTHFSVMEFLISHRIASSIKEVSRFHIPLLPSHAIIALACLGALVRLGDLAPKHPDEDSIKKIHLARYAGEYWVMHAYIGRMEVHMIDAIDHFLELDKSYFSTWVKLQGPDIMTMFSVVESGWPKELLPPAAPLYLAARSRFAGLLEHLVVKHPQQVNAYGGEHGTPLHVAVLMGHIDVAQFLFAHGADINSRSADERTPLHIASQVGKLEVGRWLLDCGADVNPEEDDGSESTPLHLAASNGHLEVSRMLLEHNAAVNALDYNGHTPLLNASASLTRNADIVQLLLKHSADAHVRDNMGNTPLHFAASRGHLEVARTLLALNVEINARNHNGYTPFLRASESENPDVVRLLLDHIADVRNNSGMTPLHMVASTGCLEVARILLERSEEVNARDDEGSTALHKASQAWEKGHPDLVELLLDHGADAHVRDNSGSTSLHVAAYCGCLKVSRILLERNAEVNALDDNGSTPLLRASKAGHLDVVQLLLDYDADVHMRDNSGNTALHLAAAGGGFGLVFARMAKLFVDENSRNDDGSIRLHQASDDGEGSPEVVRLLLDHGVDVQVCNNSGKTASEVARGLRRQQIVQLLSGDAAEFTSKTGPDHMLADVHRPFSLERFIRRSY